MRTKLKAVGGNLVFADIKDNSPKFSRTVRAAGHCSTCDTMNGKEFTLIGNSDNRKHMSGSGYIDAHCGNNKCKKKLKLYYSL